MNTEVIKMKQCRDCEEFFPRAKEYFSVIVTPYGTRIFQSYCRECGKLRSKKQYRKRRNKFGAAFTGRDYSKKIDLNLENLKPAFTVNSLNSSCRCARCNNPLEKRNMKYEPELSGEILGAYIYYNCPFCGQDYYPEEKGSCELVGSGTL